MKTDLDIAAIAARMDHRPEGQAADRPKPGRRERRGPPFIRLPWWFWLGYADVKFWFVTVPTAVVLMLAGWYGADWLGGLRWALFGAVALLALPFLGAAAIYIFHKVDAATYWRTLERDETVAGLHLPAGSKIRFADKGHSSVISIDLPRETIIRGMRLTGTLRLFGEVWNCILAEDQHLDGFPCRRGIAVFDKDGIQKFTLAAPYELLGLQLPAGTMVERGNDSRHWILLLPPNTGVHLPALATTAPGGVTLKVSNDGRLEGIGSGHGQTIIVRGLPLNSKNFRLQGEQVISDLTEPYFVAGDMRAEGTEVRIDLPTGEVSVARK